MPLLQALVVLAVVGVGLWLINSFIPMQGAIETILDIVLQARIHPIELTASDGEAVRIPLWAGAATLVAGVLLLFVPEGR